MSFLLKGGTFRGLNLNKSLRILSNNVRNVSNNVPKEETKNHENPTDWFNQEKEEDIDERVVPKPASVMPDHLPQVRRRQVQKPWWKFRYFIDLYPLPVEESEYTETPEYPQIFDPTKAGLKKEIRKEWYKAIRKLPTADQKIYEITKHYLHGSYHVEPVFKQFNMLPIQQAITKTQIIDGLPERYSQQNELVDPRLKEAILKAIKTRLFSVETRPDPMKFKNSYFSNLGIAKYENSKISASERDILADVVQLIRNSSSNTSDIQIDYNASVGTSWWVNDYPIPFLKKKWFQDRKEFDQCFIYKCSHPIHVRTTMPLPEVVNPKEDICLNNSTEKKLFENFNLLHLGVPYKRHNILSLPGFWPGASDGFDYPILIGLTREMMRMRIEKNGRDFNDSEDVLKGMAVMSAFSTLTAAANNLGFSLYDSLTYPLVTHVIITDGQNWSFNVYQLNKHNFHSDVAEEDQSNLINLCWTSGDLKLFESAENGELQQVNDQVLSTLVNFVNASTIEDPSFELRPYLGEDNRTDDEKAELNYSLRRKFANSVDSYVGRRKKTNLWETIYKNHHKAPKDFKRIRPKLDFKYPPFFK